MLWARKTQFAVGTQQEVFKVGTVEAPEVSAYEFAETSTPLGVANSLFVASDTGDYSTILDVSIRQSEVQGDTNVTAHASKYVASGVRFMAASQPSSIMFIYADGAPDKMFVYNYFANKESEERLQSAWNTWRLPSDSEIQWIGVFGEYLAALVYREDGLAAVRWPISRNAKDTGGEYLTRADFRVLYSADEEVAVGPFDSATDTTPITLPYSVSDEEITYSTGDDAPIIVAVAADYSGEGSGYSRGWSFPVVSIDGTTVTVSGDATGHAMYAGFRISSEREESQFWLRSESGPTLVDRLTVESLRIAHSATGAYKAVVKYLAGNTVTTYWEARRAGSPSNLLDAVAIGDGVLDVPISAGHDEYTVTLVNDSHLPSRWQSANYHYVATNRLPRR